MLFQNQSLIKKFENGILSKFLAFGYNGNLKY